MDAKLETDGLKAAGGVAIEIVDGARGRARFVRVPHAVFAADGTFHPPLDIQERARLDPRRNPSLEGRRHAMFLAVKNGRDVGRIAAHVGRAAPPGEGRFGFLCALDDRAVFRALFAAAETWLLERGASHCVGPFNFGVNEECGLLVDGFDTPPAIMMPHGAPHDGAHVEACGYEKAKDLLAYRYLPAKAPPETPLTRLAGRLAEQGALRVRRLDRKAFDAEVRLVMTLFNDAWSENWGFEPFGERAIAHLARELKALIEPHALAVAEVDGRPEAFAMILPNLNEMTRDLGGRLAPFGWAKLLWRLKVTGAKTARMPFLGVRKALQGTPLGAAAAFAAIARLRDEHVARGLEMAELSWVLEDNMPVRRVIESFGADAYKTYRIYRRNLKA